MDVLRMLLAIALPWLAGVVWLRGLWHGAGRSAWAAVLGYGYVAGMLATTLILRGMDAVGLSLAFWPAAALLAGLAALGAWVWRKLGGTGPRFTAVGSGHEPPLEKAVFLALLCVLALRLLALGAEAVTSPLSGWDAWATWAPRARVWYELRSLAPFVEWGDWIRGKSGGAYTISSAHYPPAIPLLQTWISLAQGRWDDSWIGLPWLGCAAALGLGFYGQARLFGATPLVSLTFTYLLLSLPLLDTQVALPGSADLWMAAVYGMAAFSFFRWLHAGDRRQGALALGLALSCALIKVPGIVWMLTFLPALLVARLSKAALLRVAAVAALAVGGLLASGGFALELPWLGVLDVSRNALHLPYLGRYSLAFHPEVWPAFGSSFFSLASWHLLFFVLSGIALVRLRLFVADRVFASMAALVLTGLAFMAGVYSLTPLSEFALDFTQVNRTALHMVPMLLFVALAAWIGPAPASGAPDPEGSSFAPAPPPARP